MAQFNLIWDNSEVLLGTNSTGQLASYRRKSVGGSFITTGFTPANTMATSVSAATSTNTLLDNNIYEFKIECLCTVGGPIANDNGVIEKLKFACITPVLTKNAISGTATMNLTGTDITKVKFTLRKTSDDTIVGVPQLINVVANSAAAIQGGLSGSTSYYWQTELYAIVGGVEVISSSVSHLNTVCGPYSFTTDAPPACPAPTDFIVVLNA